jgi:hypothetical protein
MEIVIEIHLLNIPHIVGLKRIIGRNLVYGEHNLG